MTLSVCLEKMENRWIAYATSLPGCFASHTDRDQALAAVPQAVREYLDWCRWNGVAIAGVDPDEALDVQEMILEWFYPIEGSPKGQEVNAFFASDAQPLSAADRSMAAALLDWTRADLLKAIDGLSPQLFDQPVEGDWNIRKIFRHTIHSAWGYLHTLDLTPAWEEAPDLADLTEVQEWVQSLYIAALTQMGAQNRIVQIEGEVWSSRKVLRRVLWHRRDHTAHIYQFREKLKIGG